MTGIISVNQDLEKKNKWTTHEKSILNYTEHKSYIKWFTLATPSIEFRLTSTSALVISNGTAFCQSSPTVTPTYTGPNQLNPTFANPFGGTYCGDLLDFRVHVSDDHRRGQTSEGSLPKAISTRDFQRRFSLNIGVQLSTYIRYMIYVIFKKYTCCISYN